MRPSLVVCATLFAAGCAETQAERLLRDTPRPENRVSLPDLAITRVTAEAVPSVGWCRSPYPLAEIKVTAELKDGRRLSTPTQLDANALSATASFGAVTPDLQYVPPVDVLSALGKPLEMEVSSRSNPNVRARLTVPPRYDCPQAVILSGRAGRPGEDGEPGPHVRVAVGMVQGQGSEPLILVRVEDANGIRVRTLLSPTAPPLQLVLDGGAGGDVGERQIRNGWGTVVARSETPAGQGGDGGAAEVLYDGSFAECLRHVQVVSRGATGTRPGRPGAIPRETAVSGDKLFRDEISHSTKLYQQPGASGNATGI
jgi:hypothetical protein